MGFTSNPFLFYSLNSFFIFLIERLIIALKRKIRGITIIEVKMALIPINKIAKIGKTTNIATKTIIRIPYQVEKNDIISSYNVVAIIIQ